MISSHCWRWDGDILALRILAQPRAHRDEIVGVVGDAIRVRLAAPPVDGKANERLIELLAAGFGVPKSRVAIRSGGGGRYKLLHIERPRRIPAALHGTIPPPAG